MSVTAAERNGLRTWIEISRPALAHNLRVFRRLLPPGCRIMAVAKSNAYGHGLYDLVPVLEELGIDAVGVDSIVEAVTLRRKGVRKPILVMGFTLPSRFEDAVRNDVAITISNIENLRALASAADGRRIKIHIKVDTGMNRQGFLPDQLPELLRFLKKRSGRFAIEGLYTHFAAAKDPRRTDSTEEQIAAFEAAADAFAKEGFKPIKHACATAGVFNYPGAHYDMARIGIGIMGYWPSPKTKAALEDRIALRPALSWRTIVSETKLLPKGAAVGYEFSERVARPSKIGICPVGYWHGYPWSLSGRGRVLVRGHKVKVLGRISMDMTVVDLTDVPGAKIGDVVTLIGSDRGETIPADETAALAGTTVYEFLTRLNPLIRKFVWGRTKTSR
ncbi:MAG: alanine racemase [Candidatus Aminicenantales bacterium]